VLMLLYRIVTSLLYWLLYIGKKHRALAGSERWRGRLGLIACIEPVDVWLHASSVGEVKVISFLVAYLHARKHTIKLHVTTMTTRGHETAVREFGDYASVSFFPVDATPAVQKTLDAVSPEVLVIAETEIWPNLVAESNNRNIPIILVNGRMSQKAFKRYQKVRSVLEAVLNKYDRFFFKTKEDMIYYQRFGIQADKGILAGDMKFDAALPERPADRIQEIRSTLGVEENDFLMVAGSTRSGEEIILADLYKSIRTRHPNFKLVIAPRHVERASEVTALFSGKQLKSSVWGETNGIVTDSDSITIVDEMGILNDLYMSADLAFVGGTLVNVGGHNLLEPVWAGTPVLFGPSLDNVHEAADYIIEHDYGAKVQDKQELLEEVEQIMCDQRYFARKTENDLSMSATTVAGDYILSRLDNA